MQPLFDLTPFSTEKPAKSTTGLALFDWATVQDTRQEAVIPAIPLPSDTLWTEYLRTLYVGIKGEKGAYCSHCKQHATNPKQLQPMGQGWGKCENVFCEWRNIKRDKQAGTVESRAWVAGYEEKFNLTFPAWYEQVNSEVTEATDHPAQSWTTWDKLHRAWLSGDSPSGAAGDILYKHGFTDWDDDGTTGDEDSLIGG